MPVSGELGSWFCSVAESVKGKRACTFESQDLGPESGSPLPSRFGGLGHFCPPRALGDDLLGNYEEAPQGRWPLSCQEPRCLLRCGSRPLSACPDGAGPWSTPQSEGEHPAGERGLGQCRGAWAPPLHSLSPVGAELVLASPGCSGSRLQHTSLRPSSLPACQTFPSGCLPSPQGCAPLCTPPKEPFLCLSLLMSGTPFSVPGGVG